MQTIFYKPVVADYPRLLEIWEASVRATHEFLKEEDILFFKKTIWEKELFSLVDLTCMTVDGKIAGFIGISSDSVEMLFVDPAFHGKGIGKALLQKVIAEHDVTKVDVNEQNEQAARFYERFGFRTVSRSEVDGMGLPFPILHMELG